MRDKHRRIGTRFYLKLAKNQDSFITEINMETFISRYQQLSSSKTFKQPSNYYLSERNGIVPWRKRNISPGKNKPLDYPRKVVDRVGFKPQKTTVLSSYPVHLVISVIFLLAIAALSICQQTYCPKSCTCDDQSLEIHCRGSLDKGLSGLPLTLNPNTERLTINNAQTSQLTGVDSVNKLKTLDLAYNKLALIDFSDITRNTMLVSFNSSHNNISELKDSIVTNSLVDLDITAHNFDTYDERVESELRKKLTKINVAKFDLSHNYLTILRNLTFIRWHKLQNLDLSHNQLSILETHSLFGLNNLENISLRANRLVQLPSIALQGTTRSVFNKIRVSSTDQSPIRFIDLSGNSFMNIGSGAFAMLGKAQDIYLDSCSIQSISDHAFAGLLSLRILSLNQNSLQRIPSQSFSDLSRLKVLALNENNISTIEANSFSSLVNLKKLQLSRCSFRELGAGAFRGLSNLQQLQLTQNPNFVTVKSGTFDDLSSLSILDLHSNSLPHIPADVNHESLVYLDMRYNPLECGCNLRWLTSWLKKFNDTIMQADMKSTEVSLSDIIHDFSGELLLTNQILNLNCSGPPALYGQPVIELPISKLECLEPTSELNVLMGYIALFSITTLLFVVCLTNFIQNKKHLLTLLKDNLVQSHIPAASPYATNLHKNVDNLKKETQLYNSDYENIDYGPQAQIYSIQGDQIMYYNPQQQYPQQIQLG